MSNNKKLGIFGGNEKLLEAILENDKPLRLTEGHEEAQREAKSLDEKESYPSWKEYRMVRKHWTDQARFRYNGKRNAKRKGTIRNNAETWMLRRLS